MENKYGNICESDKRDNNISRRNKTDERKLKKTSGKTRNIK